LQNTWTGQLISDSYIWRPWLATWRLGAGTSIVLDYAEQDSQNFVVTGEGQLRIFPQSRFPFFGYFDVQDMRVNFDEEAFTESQDRTVRYGFLQQDRALSGSTDYSTNMERIHQNEVDGPRDQVTDVIQFNGRSRFGAHNLSGTFDFVNVNRQFAGEHNRAFSGIARHGYRPSGRFSVESSLDVNQLDIDASQRDSSVTNLRFDSLGLWQHQSRPLQVLGQLDVRSSWGDRGLDDGPDRFASSNARLGAQYALTRALLLAGDVGGAVRDDDGDPDGSFVSNASVSYVPIAPRHHGAILLRHGINRTSQFDTKAPTSLGFDLSQDFSGFVDSERSEQADLSERISFTANRRSRMMSTQLRLWALFTSRFVSNPGSIFKISTTLSNSHNLSLYSLWAVSATVNAFVTNDTDTSGNSESSGSPFISADLEYRHSRLFDVPRLRLISTLRLDANNASGFGIGRSGNRLSWENRFDYLIGKVQIEFTTNITNPGTDTQNATIVLAIQRFF
jgi:hypothetical protein